MIYHPHSPPPLPKPSAGPDIKVLDSHTLQDYTFPLAPYAPVDPDEFGFDPPNAKPAYIELDQTYRPLESGDGLSFGRWPGFVRGIYVKDSKQECKQELGQTCGISQLILPHAANAVSRFGHITPPRTNSISSDSIVLKNAGSASPIGLGPKRKPRIKPKRKEIETLAPASCRRKRKKSAKAAANAAQTQTQTPEDAKRKTSLEKNRLAAAKCRIKKKQNTEQLQQDSYDKVVLNSFLKDQITCMKGEIQQMNALLLAHANCIGCISPEEIQKHVGHMGDEFLAQQMLPVGHGHDEFSHMQLEDMQFPTSGPVIEDGYFEPLCPESPHSCQSTST